MSKIEYDKNNIFVGFKDTSDYLMFALSKLLNGDDEITLTGRGNLVSKTISVAMILRDRYIKIICFETSIDTVLLNDTYVPVITIWIGKNGFNHETT